VLCHHHLSSNGWSTVSHQLRFQLFIRSQPGRKAYTTEHQNLCCNHSPPVAGASSSFSHLPNECKDPSPKKARDPLVKTTLFIPDFPFSCQGLYSDEIVYYACSEAKKTVQEGVHRRKAGEGNRTLIAGLGSQCITTMLRPQALCLWDQETAILPEPLRHTPEMYNHSGEFSSIFPENHAPISTIFSPMSISEPKVITRCVRKVPGRTVRAN
jgi:hypothetical protein